MQTQVTLTFPTSSEAQQFLQNFNRRPAMSLEPDFPKLSNEQLTNKISVIKALRQAKDMGLKEAKDATEFFIEHYGIPNKKADLAIKDIPYGELVAFVIDFEAKFHAKNMTWANKIETWLTSYLAAR